MKNVVYLLATIIALSGCRSTDRGNATETTPPKEEIEATPPQEAVEAPPPPEEKAPKAEGCPEAMPVGYVECATAGQTCSFPSGECACGDHDGNGTSFWKCAEVSAPTLDPATGEPE